MHSLVGGALWGRVADDSKVGPEVGESCRGGHKEAQQLEVGGQTQSLGPGWPCLAPGGLCTGSPSHFLVSQDTGAASGLLGVPGGGLRETST